MPQINASKNAIAAKIASSFTAAREASDSDSATLNTTSSNIMSVRYLQSSGRGSTSVAFTRSYLAFDFTGYTSGTITNLKFHYTSTTGAVAGETCRLVKTNAFGTSTSFVNYASDDWFDSLDLSTLYSNSFSWPDASQNNSVSLVSQAITDAQSDGYLQFAILQTNDQSGLNPGFDATNTSFGNWSSNRFNLQFDFTAAGFGEKINSIQPANMAKVNSIAKANIAKINSVQ